MTDGREHKTCINSCGNRPGDFNVDWPQTDTADLHELARCIPGDVLDAVSFEKELVLYIDILGDLDTLAHWDCADDLFTEEVTDRKLRPTLLCVGIDREMRIHQAHLIPVCQANRFIRPLAVGAPTPGRQLNEM